MMESTFADNFENSPLSKDDINLIGSTNLSVSEKHHLRMLLHCLECFKSMSKGNEKGLILNFSSINYFMSPIYI